MKARVGRRNIGRLQVAAAVASLVVCPAAVQAQAPTLSAFVDTTLITVGDWVRMTLEVEHRVGSTVEWPDSLDLGPFEVRSVELAPPVTQAGRVRQTLRLSLTAFELGELEIPSFSLDVLDGDGSVARLETDPYGIEVVSVGLDEGGAIRAIKEPLTIPLSVASLLPWVLLAVLVAGAGIWLWRRRVDPGERRSLGPVRIPRPAHEVALAALDELERSNLLERGKVKRFHVEVSEILRTYVEGRFDVFALEMTSVEVIDALRRVGIEASVLDDFGEFLERCDLVKFAKLRPGADASRGMLDLARSLVHETKPQVMELEATGTEGDR